MLNNKISVAIEERKVYGVCLDAGKAVTRIEDGNTEGKTFAYKIMKPLSVLRATSREYVVKK